MLKALSGRILALLLTTFGIAVVTFAAIRIVPGDPVVTQLGENYDPAVADRLRAELGLDRPVIEQFFTWFTNLLHGDLGNSIRTGRPVVDELVQAMPATIELATSAILLSVIVSIPAGVFAARRRGTGWDLAVRTITLGGVAIPNFLLGILLIMLCAVVLKILPAGGYVPFAEDPAGHLARLVLPSITLALGVGAATMRMMRASLLDVLGQNFIRTARSKGLAPNRVVYRHGVRNALLPVITVIGIQVGMLLGGSVVVEQLFSWPGLGSMVLRAISQRDYPLLQGGVMLLAALFVVANFFVDVIYLYLNPRLRVATQ